MVMLMVFAVLLEVVMVLSSVVVLEPVVGVSLGSFAVSLLRLLLMQSSSFWSYLLA